MLLDMYANIYCYYRYAVIGGPGAAVERRVPPVAQGRGGSGKHGGRIAVVIILVVAPVG